MQSFLVSCMGTRWDERQRRRVASPSPLLGLASQSGCGARVIRYASRAFSVFEASGRRVVGPRVNVTVRAVRTDGGGER
jgi:hypothetical protein